MAGGLMLTGAAAALGSWAVERLAERAKTLIATTAVLSFTSGSSRRGTCALHRWRGEHHWLLLFGPAVSVFSRVNARRHDDQVIGRPVHREHQAFVSWANTWRASCRSRRWRTIAERLSQSIPATRGL